jgi:hypothetical protein
MDAAQHKQLMKMAVQTVLFQYKPVLENAAQDHGLIDQIASDITCLIQQMESVTNQTWRELG